MCGVFEGVHTVNEYKVLNATFENGVVSGEYNWNTGMLTGQAYGKQEYTLEENSDGEEWFERTLDGEVYFIWSSINSIFTSELLKQATCNYEEVTYISGSISEEDGSTTVYIQVPNITFQEWEEMLIEKPFILYVPDTATVINITEQLEPQEMTLLKGKNEIFTNDGINYIDQLYVPHVDSTLTQYGSAADAGEIGYRLGNSGQGYHASYDITQGPGWYRAAMMIRSTSGIVEMGILQNKPKVGRFGQNLIFGFSGFSEIVSPNFSSAANYPRDIDARPHIFQVSNHTYGEDFDIAEAAGRAIRIDKLRISYPKIWTD